MTSRLCLICHAATDATRAAAFPADELVDPPGLVSLAQLAVPTRKIASWTSPAERARQTARALGLNAADEPMLREVDHGRWRGLKLEAVAAQEPAALHDWLRDPSFDGHGGESLEAMIGRVDVWLDRQGSVSGRVFAVTHASVIRAALVNAIGAGPQAYWRFDIAPATSVELTGTDGRWNLHAIGPLAEARPLSTSHP